MSARRTVRFDPARIVFIDHARANVDAALFTASTALRADLMARQLL